jgi:hypothetical protein
MGRFPATPTAAAETCGCSWPRRSRQSAVRVPGTGGQAVRGRDIGPCFSGGAATRLGRRPASSRAGDAAGLLVTGSGVISSNLIASVAEHTRDIRPISDFRESVVDAERGLVYLSANDGYIWVAPLEGGVAKGFASDPSRFHFLHVVSRDGTALAFVELPAGTSPRPGAWPPFRRRVARRETPTSGPAHLDGPESSPDGNWLYVTTELGIGPGHASSPGCRSRAER